MFQKVLKGILIAAYVIAMTYAWSWYESNSMSARYYQDALRKFNNGDYISALKGEEFEKEDKSGYYFSGGFQQVVQIWEHPFACPRPDEYKLAGEKINEIIDEKITIEMGMEMFNRYFRQDNFYLGRVLLKTGERYYEKGEQDKAMDTYRMAREIFVLNEDIVKEADEKIMEIMAQMKQ